MNSNSATPDSEVVAKATRRRFTAAEKARILDAYEGASDIERAALLRRERIYSSLLYSWRKQRASGKPLSVRRGPKPDPEGAEATRSQRRISELERKLEKAERVIDIQGKVYALLRACAGESADNLDLPPWNKRPAK
jgi:transposase-like protein